MVSIVKEDDSTSIASGLNRPTRLDKMAASSRRSLPDECLLLIASYCDPATLRQYRLASKSLSELGSIHLFASMRLVPNIDCLTSFVKTFENSLTALSIRTLIYDISWETTIADIKSRCESFHSSANSDSYSAAATEWIQIVDLEKLEQIYNTALCGRTSDSHDEQEELRSVLSCLPRVSQLVVTPDSYNYQRPVPSYYRNLFSTVDLLKARSTLLLPLGPVTDDTEHIHSVLMAFTSIKNPLLHFQIRDTKWTAITGNTDFIQRHATDSRPTFWKTIFQSLTSLDLGLRGSGSRQSPDLSRPIRHFMKGCARVETLRLTFSEHVQRRCAHDHRISSNLGPLLGPSSSMRALLPTLKTLALSSANVTQQDLLKFLAIHSTSLRSLRLANIFLLRHDTVQDRKPCWVEVIKFIRSNLDLSEIEFSGWLNNGGRQKWFVSQNAAQSERIRPSVQRYILDKAEMRCPLDCVAIRPNQEDVDKPLPGADEFGGDWTWTMTYPISKQRHVAEPVLSGDHFFSKDVQIENKAPLDARVKSGFREWIDPTYLASESWSTSFQQPPQKKHKSIHSPTDVQSPSSIWSSSPALSDSSASSFYDALTDIPNKIASSLTTHPSTQHPFGAPLFEDDLFFPPPPNGAWTTYNQTPYSTGGLPKPHGISDPGWSFWNSTLHKSATDHSGKMPPTYDWSMAESEYASKPSYHSSPPSTNIGKMQTPDSTTMTNPSSSHFGYGPPPPQWPSQSSTMTHPAGGNGQPSHSTSYVSASSHFWPQNSMLFSNAQGAPSIGTWNNFTMSEGTNWSSFVKKG